VVSSRASWREYLQAPVRLSPGTREVHVTAEHLYLVTHDELDVPYVVHFKIIEEG